MNAVNLTNQVAVVTGAGRGIGRAIAQTLAHHGASVSLMARSANELAETASLIHSAGGRAQSFPTDIADPAVARTKPSTRSVPWIFW